MTTNNQNENENSAIILRRERDRFVAFAFTGSDLLVECSSSGTIQFMSGVVGRLGVTNIKEMIGLNLNTFVPKSDHLYLDSLFENIWRTGRMRPVSITLQSLNGQRVKSIMRCMRYGDAIYTGFTINPIIVRPTSDTAAIDEKTGLMTKDSFIERANQQVELLSQQGGGVDEARLTLMEVDGLSDISDETLADEINQSLGALFRSWSSGGDAAGAVGEDRFGVVSDGAVDVIQLESMMEQFRTKAGKALHLHTVEVDLDVGKVSDEDASRALMYAINTYSEAEDVNTYTISSLEQGAQRYLTSAYGRIAEIREILDQHNFTMAFQPIVDLKTGDVHHFEALSRLVGHDSPYEMVTFAEKVGMILDFDIMVAKRIVDMLQEERIRGRSPCVAMNVSAKSLQSSLFLNSFRGLMNGAPHLIQQISLEITETAHVGELGGFNSVIQMLRTDGHEIALDDVGTGSTSFETLRNLEVDYAKIDGQYIRSAATSPKDRAVLDSLVHMCQALDMQLIGEMVETPSQLKLLQDLEIGFAQGYYFSKPVKGLAGLVYPQPSPEEIKRGRQRKGEISSWG